MTKDDRRNNRRDILEALNSETGSFGGDAAAPRVRAYIADPVGASTVEFAFVGALTLQRFYIDPQKPNASERRGLWQAMLAELNQGSAKDPGGWGTDTSVLLLQAIVEGALEPAPRERALVIRALPPAGRRRARRKRVRARAKGK